MNLAPVVGVTPPDQQEAPEEEALEGLEWEWEDLLVLVEAPVDAEEVLGVVVEARVHV